MSSIGGDKSLDENPAPDDELRSDAAADPEPRADSGAEPAAAVAPAASTRHPGRSWAVPLALLIGVVLGWLAYGHFHEAPAEPPAADTLAADAAGGWWNIAGDRYLQLDWDGRRATLTDYSASDKGVTSTGSWRTTDHTVIVHVTGAAGELSKEFELVGNEAEMFLAPTPAASARLMDCWIADHGDGDDNEEPHGPRSVQAMLDSLRPIHPSIAPVAQRLAADIDTL